MKALFNMSVTAQEKKNLLIVLQTVLKEKYNLAMLDVCWRNTEKKF